METILLDGRPNGVVGAGCSRCGARAVSKVVTREGATLAVRPGTVLEARCTSCGHVDAYPPERLTVFA